MAEKETKKKNSTNIKSEKSNNKKTVKKNSNTNSTKTTQAKKTTQSKKNVQTKKTPNKSSTKTNTTTKTSTSKKTPKVTTKASTTTSKKKTETKKVVKKVEQKAVKKVEPEVVEVDLEKTLIFDGRQNQNLAEVVEKLEEENVVLEDKIIKRSKAKKILIIILALLIILVIALTSWYVIDNELNRMEATETINSNIYNKVSKKYHTISDIKESSKDNGNTTEDIEYDNIETITLAEFERKILEKEDMTILIASETCYHCIVFEPTISKVFKAQEKTIYRINITALTNEEITRFRTYYAFEITPTIFRIENGIAVSELTGVSAEEELTNWIKENA